MLKSSAFDYINLLDKAADASWKRNEVISNNIANIDTPGFKRKDIDFHEVLTQALGYNRCTTMDEKVGNLMTGDLDVTVKTDYAGYSYRLDGNNVDLETENAMLAKNQLIYKGLMSSISQEFKNLATVLKK